MVLQSQWKRGKPDYLEKKTLSPISPRPGIEPIGGRYNEVLSSTVPTLEQLIITTNSTGATQALINKSLAMFTTEESGYISSLANQKQEHL